MNIFTDGTFLPSIAHYLILNILLFTGGFLILISNANLYKTLIGLMVLLNAIVLNFALGNAYLTEANSLAAHSEGIKSTLVSNFAPLRNIILNFDSATGDATAFYVLILGSIQLIFGAVMAFYAYTRFKTTETEAFCELKSDENKKDGEF